MRLKIGEFARLGQVSVQTLRYYDNLGLIRPVETDPFSNYRYYTLDQLPRLMQILALKDMGFSLEQVTHLLENRLETAELRRMLLLKQQEVRDQLQEQLDRLDRIDARLRWMEQDQAPPACEVTLKRVEPLRVASVRGQIPNYWAVSPLWIRLSDALQARGLEPQGPWLTLYHAGGPEIDVEVCAPIPFDAPSGDGLSVQVLPLVETMACTLVRGPFTGIASAFTGLVRWIDANGFAMSGPDREVYLRLPEKDRYDSDPDAITELQVPVQRLAPHPS